MASLDYKPIFSRVLYEEMGRIFGEHGIEFLYEEELNDIVEECVDKCYMPSIREYRRSTRQSLFGKKTMWG